MNQDFWDRCIARCIAGPSGGAIAALSVWGLVESVDYVAVGQYQVNLRSPGMPASVAFRGASVEVSAMMALFPGTPTFFGSRFVSLTAIRVVQFDAAGVASDANGFSFAVHTLEKRLIP